MSTRPEKTGPSEGGNKKHRQAPYNKNAKGKAGSGSGAHPGNANAGGVPGVSKIKGQIRQTTRLLSKENLAPALRVQTERRLTSLQKDLAKAEHRTVERKNGERYHMVKFFERKKILRIIKRIQRQLKELEGPDAGKGKEKVEGDGESTREELEKELEDARIMLNYVIHYPNTLKYVSLFPVTAPNGKSKADEESEEQQARLVLPPLLSQAAIDAISAAASQSPTNKKQKQKSGNTKVDKRRLDMLLKIRDLMHDLAAGKVAGDVAISLQPENEKEDDRWKKISFDDVLGIKTTPNDIAGTSSEAAKADVEQKAKEEDDFFE